MAKIPTKKVVNPDAPDDFMIINESDFNPDVHKLWEGEEPEESGSGASTEPTPNTGDDTPTLPEGYEVEHAGAGYFFLMGPDGQAIEGPSNGKWQGRDAAIAAAIDHASHAAGGE